MGKEWAETVPLDGETCRRHACINPIQGIAVREDGGPVIDHLERLGFRMAGGWFRRQTLLAIRHDLRRLLVRMRRPGRRNLLPRSTRLNIGCGSRMYAGWLNVDLANSDLDVDIAAARLPWKSGSFRVIVGLHCLEHLDLMEECVPLLIELHRLLGRGGELWVACPDMEKVCRAYLSGTLHRLLENRRHRWPSYRVGLPSRRGAPARFSPGQGNLFTSLPLAYMVNDYFHQYGEHRNLYDEEILTWALSAAGFESVERVSEEALRSRFPEIPPKGDDPESIYMRAVKTA